MRKSRVSPARSEGDRRTPQCYNTRSSQSFTTSPSRSSRRLTAIVDEYKDKNRESFPLTPLGKTVLNDDTNIEQPRRTSWWKKVDKSRDVIEVLHDNKPEAVNDVLEEFDVEILSQSQKKDHTVDLPDSSDNDTINSIVVPQRKLFTQKENIPQKKYGQVAETRETLAKHNKTIADDDINDKACTKNLFGQGSKRTKPIFPAALLNISPDKTIGNKTKELVAEAKAQPRSLFGNRPGAKRKNVFADFIVSESEEEIPDIEPKRFTFSKRPEPIRRVSTASRGTREPSPTMSITTDIEMDDWKMLPSSTMMEHQLEVIVGVTPSKKARLSKLSEAKESEAGTGITGNTDIRSEKSKSSINSNIKEIADENDQDDEEFSLTYVDNEQPNDDVHSEPVDNKTEREPRDKTHTILKSNDKPEENTTTIALANEQKSDTEQRKINDNKNKTHTIVKSSEKTELNLSNEHLKPNDNKNKTHTVIKSPDKTELNLSVKEKSKMDSTKTKDKSFNRSKALTKDNTIATKDATTSSEKQDERHNTYNVENENMEVDLEEQIEYPEQVVLQKANQMVKEKELREFGDQDGKIKEISEQAQSVKVKETHVNENKSAIEKMDTEKIIKDMNEEFVEELSQVDENNDEKSNVLDSADDTEIELDCDDKQQDGVASEQESNNENQELEANENDESSDDNDKEATEFEEGEAETEYEDKQSVAESDAENDKLEASVEIERNDEIDAGDGEENEMNDEEDEENNDEQDDAEGSEKGSAVNEDNLEQSYIESDQEDEVNNTQVVEEAVDKSQAEADEADQMEQEDSEEQIDEILEKELYYEDDNDQGEESEEDEDNHESEVENEIENTNDNQESDENNKQPNESLHSPDTTGRHRNNNISKSPEAILHEMSNQADSFIVKGRNTSIRNKSILKNFSIRPSMAPPRESTGLSDGTNTSAEGSGWDSHRTTRKTLRQTFGRDFTPRKSLRALVMEKSAKRQTQINAANAELRAPHENSSELQENLPPDSEINFEDSGEMAESDHEISKRTRQTTLELYLQKIKSNNIERNKKIEEQVRNSFKSTASRADFLNRAPYNPLKCRAKTKSLQKPVAKKRPVSSMFPLEDLPLELKDDMKYKPPKRFRPSNAPWITKRLYKFLETKLEPKYDYKARVRAEKLVETIYHFAKDTRRYRNAQPPSVIELKKEMARLNIVKTHYDFYNFFHDYMPVEVRVKVVPDIVNEIPLPREGLFSNIVTGE